MSHILCFVFKITAMDMLASIITLSSKPFALHVILGKRIESANLGSQFLLTNYIFASNNDRGLSLCLKGPK